MNKPIHTLILLDASGSMKVRRTSMLQALEALQSQLSEYAEQHPSQRMCLTMASFREAHLRYHLLRIPQRQAKMVLHKSYSPDGLTNLYDATGIALTDLERYAGDARNIRTIVYIFTDGQENNSTRWDAAQVRSLIGRLEECGWEFHYMTCDPQAQEQARDMGIQKALYMAEYDFFDSVAATAGTFHAFYRRTDWIGQEMEDEYA